MAISIPTIEQLTDDQWEVQDLPISGRYMITGGPGSGKTSIAIRRTQHIKKDDPKARVSTFLFTNTLNDFFNDGIKSLNVSSNVQVWAKWQRKVLIQHGEWPYGPQDPVPWKTLSDKILSLPLDTEYHHLIIDEGQDFSVSDLKVMSLVAENVTVFADENQRLSDRAIDSIKELVDCLNIENDDTYHLKENHRNTLEIIKAAVSLAPNEIDVTLEEVKRSGSKPLMISHKNAEDEIKYIARVIRSNVKSARDVGIFHLERKVITDIYYRLKEELGEDIEIELMKRNTFDFTNNNPKICTLNSAKGLEFDVVIMPQMNKDNYYEHPSNLKRIYVGMTRARSELILSYHGGYPTVYLSQIDPNTIKRETN